MKLFNKKGVSPLIATVLLIAFAVALGVVVMNWGKDYVETTAKDAGEKADADLSCQMDIEIGIKEIANRKKICYTNSTSILEVMIENKGREPVEGIRFILIDVDDEISQTDNKSLSIGAGSVSSKYFLNYSSDSLSDLQYVEIIPMITPKGKNSPEPCSSNILEIESIGTC
jgi:flagellin-like protein